jgi:hypothetical protein
MDYIFSVFYFGVVLGALPLFAALVVLALVWLRGWPRFLSLALAVSMAYAVFREFGPVLVHAKEMEPSDFRRLLYERWSEVSRPALYACAGVLTLLASRALTSRKRR